jgi:diadenosine tetraphosphate (Ap4A) HIT family hydrolase
MSPCVICDSLDGKPKDVLVELQSCWVTAAHRACLPGYVSVVSRQHVVEPFELDDGGAWWSDCMLVARALNDELRPMKMNYEIHGNTIPHLHLHVYPRTADDPFMGRPIEGTALLFERSPQDLERLRQAITAAIR